MDVGSSCAAPSRCLRRPDPEPPGDDASLGADPEPWGKADVPLGNGVLPSWPCDWSFNQLSDAPGGTSSARCVDSALEDDRRCGSDVSTASWSL